MLKNCLKPFCSQGLFFSLDFVLHWTDKWGEDPVGAFQVTLNSYINVGPISAVSLATEDHV